MKKEPRELLNQIAQILFDKKGVNILALDVHKVSTLTDYFLIGEGNVDKHVIVLAKAVIDEMKKQGEVPVHVEGLSSGDWVVIDYLELVIHLFKPGIREKYRIEELWHEGELIDLELKVPQTGSI